jgi:hypothetical protein
MKYMLLIYSNEKQMRDQPKAENEKSLAAYGAYAQAMQKAGVMVGGDRLRPTDASTTVKVANGKTQVLNGPYAESREQLGGYFIVDVPDIDAAIS